MKRVTVPFFISHQGCPHTCVFCDQRVISGSSGHFPGVSEIIGKIASWQESAGGRPLEVAFFGGTFTALDRTVQQRLLDPLQPLIQKGVLSGVRISTRPDAIDDEIIDWLCQRGVSIIEVGVQSMDDAVLAAAGRGHTAAQSQAAMGCIRKAGLPAVAQLMPGLPGDSPALAMSSLDKVISAGANQVRIYPVVVLAGTALAQQYHSGSYRPLDLDSGIDLCKRMYLFALRAGVPILRLGLQADDGLNHETVVAGCWHPALGQLVRSELYYDLLVRLLRGSTAKVPMVTCHPRRLSDLVGNGKRNLSRLEKVGVLVERVTTDPLLPVTDIVVNQARQSLRGSLHDIVY